MRLPPSARSWSTRSARALPEGVREDVAGCGNVARLLDADDDWLGHAAVAARF
jgi:hypothetical protein